MAAFVNKLSPYFPKWIKNKADTFLAKAIHPSQLMIKQWEGVSSWLDSQPSMQPKRLCFFAHFDRDGKIDPYVVYYLEQLRLLQADIVFISSSENLIESEVQKVLPFCSLAIQRKNRTLDFGSWRVGLEIFKEYPKLPRLSDYDELILANDSVFGPLFPLKPIFDEMESKQYDLWSITSSNEKTYHLQSYFLVMNSKFIRSDCFQSFWKHFVFYQSKARIIAEYEIGLSKKALQSNHKIGAWLEASRLNSSERNPTLFHWEELIRNYHCPFFKTEIPRLNRFSMENVKDWEKVIQTSSQYNSALIRQNLDKSRNNKH